MQKLIDAIETRNAAFQNTMDMDLESFVTVQSLRMSEATIMFDEDGGAEVRVGDLIVVNRFTSAAIVAQWNDQETVGFLLDDGTTITSTVRMIRRMAA